MIFGGLDDQVSLLIWTKISSVPFTINKIPLITNSIYFEMFQSFLRPQLSDQPVLWFFISLFSSIMGKYFYNIFLIVSILGTFFASHLLFKKFKYSYFYALVFTFSSNMWIHLGKHPALMMLWIFPIGVYLLEKLSESKYENKKLISVSIFIGISLLISQYYGYFLLIFFTLWIFLDLLFRKINFLFLVKKYLLFFVVVLCSTSIFLFPYIKDNYLEDVRKVKFTSSRQLHRPIEDFITFSSRPWYFFIPSPKSPIYQNFSTSIIEKIRSTEYFLADDYFQGEHDGNFFGFAFYALFIYVLFLYLKSYKNIGDSSNHQKILKYFFIFIILTIFSLPPFISVSGITIYMPSYLLYKLFPMFRSLTRLSILQLLTMLMMLGYMFNILKGLNLKSVKKLSFLLPVIALFIISETYVRVKIYIPNKTPEVYSYMGENFVYKKFVVFPYDKTQEAFYYLPEHKQELVNIRYFVNKDYSSEELTEIIPSDEGIKKLKDLDVNYIVVFENAEEQYLTFFQKSKEISKVVVFSEATLYKINE